MKLNFLNSIANMQSRRNAILADEQRRQKSKSFGVWSIIFSLFTLICSIGGSFLVKTGLANDFVMLILCCVFGAVLILGAVGFIAGAFIRAVYQRSINKLPIGRAALIIAILSLILSLAASVLVFVL